MGSTPGKIYNESQFRIMISGKLQYYPNVSISNFRILFYKDGFKFRKIGKAQTESGHAKHDSQL